MRDHPVIENLMRTGTPDGKEERYAHCPVCGAECDYIFKNKWEILGCDVCIDKVDSFEVAECYE